MKKFFWAILIFYFVSPFKLLDASSRDVILATTTSTQDSGLLDVLIPIFEKKTGYFVKTIAVGSGQAMAIGRRGEADVLLVHSPNAEKNFIAQGYGINRRIVMYNDFIIVGEKQDPARIKGMKSAPLSFQKIALTKSLFISRGDNSGTHSKENDIWKLAGINPEKEKWYHQTGLGMGQTLNVAAEKRGYTLTDRGSYLALKKNLDLFVMVEGDRVLLNIYHVIEVNPDKWPKVNATGGKAFADFIVSEEAQKIIKTFGVDKFGLPFFSPCAGKKEEELAK
jgi:tungstate transport system substrate-binding protein